MNNSKKIKTITITLTEEELKEIFDRMSQARAFCQACIDNVISKENILTAEYENITATREMLENINIALNDIQFEICVP